jgi:hypothetical protein
MRKSMVGDNLTYGVCCRMSTEFCGFRIRDLGVSVLISPLS